MRLIDKDELMAFIKANGYVYANTLENFPEVDAVPVVRCGECKSHGTLKSGELFCGKIKTGIYGYYHTVKADDCCSCGAKMDGERKESEVKE